MLKRIFWFVAINLAFMATISLVFALLYMLFPELTSSVIANTRSNSNIGSIFVYSGIVGFISAFFTLALSRWSAKTFMGVELITRESHPSYSFVIDIVEKQAQQLGLKTPEIGIFHDHSMNAFATGPTKKRSLVAFSTGLLERMSKDGIEAVSAHEMAHIENGDMVTMTLVQGIVNTLVLATSRIIANLVSKVNDSEIVYTLVYIGSQIVLGILTLPISAYFSRMREFSADSDAAKLVGSQKMIQALVELENDRGNLVDSVLHDKKGYQAMAISGEESKAHIFDTHPTIEQRIAALQQ